MYGFLAKTPFVRLLLPLLAGILFQYYFPHTEWGFALLFAGLGFMLVSYVIPRQYNYRWRWLFGTGVFLFIFSTAIFSTSLRQEKSSYSFPENKESYKGVIVDTPESKGKSIACKVQLDDGKKILCYLQPGVRSRKLIVGEEIMFFGHIQPFKNFGDPDEFDYPQYMYIQGFSGSVYLYSDYWESTGESVSSLQILALRFRQSVLGFYKNLDLGENGYAILSALTLGYKDELPEDIVQSFRTTGTAHVLAVSGMHVGIIYGIVIMFISLFYRGKLYSKRIQIFIIFLLWTYALITGLPSSVIRAVVMLTVFCFANMFKRKGLTYNNIAIAAFLMLVYNPFVLFDPGFQLSFMAVVSICFFQPLLFSFISTDNKILRVIGNLFTLSVAAQLGTFPICLYYFGTFPTWFFVTNLFITPLVAIIFYVSITLLSIKSLTYLFPFISYGLFYSIPADFLKFVVDLMVGIIRFFEKFPFAIITDLRISLITTILLVVLVFVIAIYLIHKKTKTLIFSLCIILLVMMNYLTGNFFLKENVLSIYSQDIKTIIKWNIGAETFYLDTIKGYEYIRLGDKNFLSLDADYWTTKDDHTKFEIDYLHIVKTDTISLYSLTQTFDVRNVVLDRSLSVVNRRKLIRECKKLNIPYHDVVEKGMFRTNF